MGDCILKLKDRKGDTARFVGRAATTPDPDDLVTFLTGKSYCGCSEYSTVEPGLVTTPKVVLATDNAANDADYKAVLAYKDMSEPSVPALRKLTISAPIKNAANGICTVLGDDTESIPAIPPAGGVGDGGNTIMTAWETALGATAGTFLFQSGGFIKLRR